MISTFCIPITLSLITLFMYADTMPIWILVLQVLITLVLIFCMTLTEVYYSKKERIREQQIELLESQVKHLTEAVGLLSSTTIKEHRNTDKEKYY